MATFLAACDPSASGAPPPNTLLPDVPPRLRACFGRYGVDLPDRPLTVGEIERFWKTDRRSVAILRACGNDLIGWYDTLRRGWR